MTAPNLPIFAKRPIAVLIALAVLTGSLRLVSLNRPLVGNFATKNAVYAMIARNWAEGRSDMIHPMLDCLVHGHRSLHLVEMPVSAYLTAIAWKGFGGSLDAWGRATSAAMSVAAVVFLFLFVRRRHGDAAAIVAALALALSPISLIYGQYFMLEASLTALLTGTLFAVDRYMIGRQFGWMALAAILFSLLLLTKIYAIVFSLPLAVMIWSGTAQAPDRLKQRAAAFAAMLLAVLPAFAWYGYVYLSTAPGGELADCAFYSVRQSTEVHGAAFNTLLDPAWYARLFMNLIGIVLTPIGICLALAGFRHPDWRQHLAWIAASLLLVVLLPLKFFEMNYYWMAVLPALCVLAGLGAAAIEQRWRPSEILWGLICIVAIGFGARYAAGPVFKIPPEDQGVQAAGLAVQKLAKPDEPVVTIHGSSLDLLYYCDRPGWVLSVELPDLAQRLAQCRKQGARLLVIADSESKLVELAMAQSAVKEKGEGYRIYDLSPRRAK